MPAKPSTRPDPFAPRFRSVEPASLALTLAAAVDLTETRARLARRVAWFPGDAPEVVPFVDADAWLSWSLTGLRVFTMEVPSYREAMDAASRTLLVLGLARSRDNLSELSRSIGAARKVTRERLQRHGLHPMQGTAAALLGDAEADDRGSIIRAYAGATIVGLRYLVPRAAPDDRSALTSATEIVERLGRSG